MGIIKKFTLDEYLAEIRKLTPEYQYDIEKNNFLVNVLGLHHDMGLQWLTSTYNYLEITRKLETFLLEYNSNYAVDVDHPYNHVTRKGYEIFPVKVIKLSTSQGYTNIHPTYSRYDRDILDYIQINLDSYREIGPKTSWIPTAKTAFLDIESFLMQEKITHVIRISNGSNNQQIYFKG